MSNSFPFQRQNPGSPLQQHTSIHNSNAGGHSNSISNQSNNSHPQTPGHHVPSRKPSIVEMLSSPPPLPNTPDQEDIHSFSLSRNTSVSSRASSIYGNVNGGTPKGSIVGIDWAEIPLVELTESNKLISINSGFSVQKAFETLVEHNLTSVPVSLSKTDSTDLTNCLTFDYSDLNTYLLLIMNKVNVNDLSISDIGDPDLSQEQRQEMIAKTISKAKRGEEVPVDFIVKLHPKNPFVKFSEQDTLYKAMESLGNGVHRVAITNMTGSKITGILSQRRLIKYMWENARRFPSLDFYINSTLQDLKIGSNNPITIYEDQLLIEALLKMFTERVTSLAVVDRTMTLIGNISIVDVKNVTSSKNSHLLFKSVLGFIGYNLTQKGIEEGQDQFPIFHVNNQSSLGRVIAKLVATKSHRLWIVENRGSVHHGSVSSNSSSNSNSNSKSVTQSPKASPSTIESTLNQLISTPSNVQNIPPGGEPGGMPGKLVGVVTLTDILGLFASSKSNKKIDPQFARNQRRRSSTSTTRSSFESSSAGQDLFRKSYTTNAPAKTEGKR